MLISDEYKELNTKLHQENKNFGAKGYKRAIDLWQNFIKPYDVYSCLDYGCGKGTLAKAIDRLFSVPVIGYDPCVEEFSKRPKEGTFDGVICMDVLEHVEPDLLGNVLQDIRAFGNENAVYYLNVALVPSNKHLPDGRNAHLIVETKEWWAKRFMDAGFKIKKGVTEKYYHDDKTPNDKLGFFNCILRKSN